MQADLTKYAAFYKVKHQGHKLDWNHALGTVTMNACFRGGSKELSVSLYQAVVLLLFNNTEELQYTDILEQTMMGAFHCISSVQDIDYPMNGRGGRVAADFAKPSVRKEKGFEEASGWQGCGRARYLPFQPGFHRSPSEGSHQLHPS